MTTTDLVPQIPDGSTISRVGLTIDHDLPYEDWAAFGDALVRSEAGFMWVVGDWMVYGAEHYGAKAIQLAAATGLTERTVWNATSVCKRVAIDQRRPELSFKHHDAVAAQPPETQKALLQLAVDEALSASALAERVKVYGAGDAKPVTAGGKPRRVPVRFNVTFPTDDVPVEVLQEGVHHAALELHRWLAAKGYDTDVAEVL